MKCPHCQNGTLEKVKAVEPYSDYMVCDTCDSTYPLHGNIDMSKESAATNYLRFDCGLQINMKTGNVLIPPELTLDEVSKEFWQAIEQFARPFMRK